ncbi:MAG TPA: glycosyltransferase family 39 protein [Dehalococcoidia bacterium]|nr:glycosyltransferase family 39 protein [Dehalococcoidia bacterium]
MRPLRRDIVWLAAIFLLALALRVTWLHVVDPSPTDGRIDDAAVYHRLALSIKSGDGFQWEDGFSGPPGGPFKMAPTAYWSVGYPAALAGVYSLTDSSVPAGKLFNALLGATTCLLVYFVGREVFDRRVGLAAAGILALFPSQVFLPTLLMTETPWTFLTMLLLALTLALTLRKRPTWLAVALLGLAFGAASLVRGEMLAFPLVLVAVWAVAYRSGWRALRFGGIAVAAMLVALSPWTVRNWTVLGYPVLVSTGSADNLLAGHWSGADGLGSFVPGIEVNNVYKDLPAPEREIAVYKEEVRRAVSFMAHNPAEELRLIPKKLKHFYQRDSRPLDLIRVHPNALSAQNKDIFSNIANAYYYGAAGLALLGIPLWFSLRDPRKLLIVAFLLYYSFLFGFVFIGEERLHAAIIPVLSLLAGVSVVRAWERAPRVLDGLHARRAGH